jgi:RNA polymerase sigma-70 factor, ECF subfamily
VPRSSPPTFAPLLVAARARLSKKDAATLERCVRQVLQACQERWPTLRVDPRDFVRHLASFAPDQGIEAWLTRIHASDVYLAYACAAGDPRAMEHFEREVARPLAARLAKKAPSGTGDADELIQRLRQRLLVSDGKSARISQYSGAGSLLHWARAVLARLAIDEHRQPRSEPLEDQWVEGLPADSAGPELSLLRSQHRKAFQAAFRAALQTLSVEQRNRLRLHVVDGLSFEKLGRLYGVHRSTALRWIAAANAQILQEVRRHVQEALGLRTSELNSLMRLATSQLEISLSPLLREEP